MGDCSSYYTNNNTYYNHHRHLHARSRHAAGEQDAALTAGTGVVNSKYHAQAQQGM